MCKLNLYSFMGIRNTYRDTVKSAAGINYVYEDNQYYFGMTDEAEVSPIENYANILANAISSFKELPEEVKEVTLVITPTSDAEDDTNLVTRLFNVDADYTGVIESIKKNTKIAGTSTQKGLISVATTLSELHKAGVKLSCDYKEPEEALIGCIYADSAAAKSYYSYLHTGEKSITQVITPKQTRARTKDVPKLLADNLIFNWSTNNTITLGDNTLSTYYTGNGELENKKPKGEKTNKFLTQGNVYYTGNNKRLRVLGKLSAEDRYNVVILKEPSKYLDKVFEMQRDICSDIYSIEQMVVYRKQSVYAAGVSNYLEDKDLSHVGFNINGDMFTTSVPRKDISYVFNPPRLAFKIKRELENNQTKLLAYITNGLDKLNISKTDVTDVIYTKNDKGATILNPNITSKTTKLKFPNINIPTGRTVNITSTLQWDLPERNFLNKLVKDNPKVELLTWMLDDHVIGYGFVVTTDEGWLFYCSVYGSRHLLRTVANKNRK